MFRKWAGVTWAGGNTASQGLFREHPLSGPIVPAATPWLGVGFVLCVTCIALLALRIHHMARSSSAWEPVDQEWEDADEDPCARGCAAAHGSSEQVLRSCDEDLRLKARPAHRERREERQLLSAPSRMLSDAERRWLKGSASAGPSRPFD